MSSKTSNFHKSKQSAAVLKHAILNSYVTPFASKTGSTSKGNRVAFIDGYAGPGRYEDGSEGSGAMLLRKARELGAMKSPRRVECHFVESDTKTAARLREVAQTEAAGVAYSVSSGSISQHLPGLFNSLQGVPTFVYLDPCGLPIPLAEVVSIFGRTNSFGTPATEVLINLTAGLRRFAGMLYSDKPNENSLKKLDATCGGDWWRAAWLAQCSKKDATEEAKMAAELAVVQGYAERLRNQAGSAGTWIIDVKPRADLKPIYYLIFATKSIHGMLQFGEAASKGLEHWRKHNAQANAVDTLFGPASDWETGWKAEEKTLRQQWVSALTARISSELDKGEPFKIVDRIDEILGDDLVGVVRTMHLREAIKKAQAAHATTTDPTGVTDLYNLVIQPA